MKEQKENYVSALKSTTFFGGVQVVIILVQLIRSKFIAILLGPAGIGFYGLITSTLSMLESLTNFGVATSSVKNIAYANGNNPAELSRTIFIVRRLVWITGCFGALFTFLLAPVLSKITFGNYDYTGAFLMVAITILLNQVYAGNIALLQGLQANRSVGNITLVANISSLVLVIPLYYFFGQKGIVPGVIVASLVGFCFSSLLVRQRRLQTEAVPLQQLFSDGKKIMVMGIMISLSGLLALGASFLLRVFINKEDGFASVGLYNSGFAIINTYVGLIFTAMSLDYFPRLSAVSQDSEKIKLLVNQQAEIAIVLLAPIIGFFLLFIQQVTTLLYSQAFLPVIPMLFWAALGILFKSTTWSLGYILLARADNKVFFWNELVGNLVFLAFNIAGYYYLRLEGLGIAFLLGYLFNLLQIFLVVHFRHGFRFDPKFFRIFLLQLLIVVAIMLVKRQNDSWVGFCVGGLLVLFSLAYSTRIISKQVAFMPLFARFKSKF